MKNSISDSFSILFFCLVLTATLMSPSVSSQGTLTVIATSADEADKLPLINLEMTLINSTLFNRDLKTVLYFHGWMANFYSHHIQETRQAFHKLGDYNFLVADWSDYNTGNYIDAARRLNGIGRLFGQKLAKMVKVKQINLDNWHFVGESFGAHMAGAAARAIKESSTDSKFIVPRVTGLDPAGALFSPSAYVPFVLYKGLTKDDGEKMMVKEIVVI